MIEKYKGRKLKVATRSGFKLEMSVNDYVVGIVSGFKVDAEKHMAQLRKDVDAADVRRLTEPGAFGAYWYKGAPEAVEPLHPAQERVEEYMKPNAAQHEMIMQAIRTMGNFDLEAGNYGTSRACRKAGWIEITDGGRRIATRDGYRAVGMPTIFAETVERFAKDDPMYHAPSQQYVTVVADDGGGWVTVATQGGHHLAAKRENLEHFKGSEPLTEDPSADVTPDELAMRLQADQVHVRTHEKVSLPRGADKWNLGPNAHERPDVAFFQDELYGTHGTTAKMVENVNEILNKRAATVTEFARTLSPPRDMATFTSAECQQLMDDARREERMEIAHQVRGMFDGQPLSKSMLEYIAKQIEMGR